MTLASLWNWRRTIPFRLACLVLVCVLPLWLAAGSIVYFTYQAKKTAIELHLRQTAQELREAVDRELALIQSVLGALATSPALAAGDFGSFHEQARELLKSYEGADIILADASGQQLVNSYRPLGAPLPKRNIGSKAFRRVFEEKRPGVSNLFKGAVTGRYLVSVDVPVIYDGKVVYDLAMTLPTDRITAILAEHPLPPHWVGLIMDSERVAVYRTLYPERYVGKQIPPLMGAPGPGEVVKEFRNLENVHSLASLSRSPETGWAVVIHVPKAEALTTLRTWLLWTAAGTLFSSLVGVALAMLIGRNVSHSIRALIRPALDLARGKVVSQGSYGFLETDAVGKALSEASQLLHERTENLKRSNRELEEFAAVASHDLQEPLRKIIAFGERLRENNAHNLDATGEDFLRRMEGAAMRMQNLILDLLEYSRVTSRANPFVLVALGSLAQEAKSDLDALIAETGGVIDIDLLPAAEVDAAQIRRVFQNLFSNALKFHGEAPPRITVRGEIVVENDRKFARVSVEDNGIGFAPQYRERIFQPFQRLHGRSKFPGTGIGLAIVKKIVERHGGLVTAQGMPEKGSTFILTFPLKQP